MSISDSNGVEPNFQELELHYVNCDSFVFNFKTRDIIQDLCQFEKQFNFSSLDEIYDVFSNVEENIIRTVEIEVFRNFLDW